MTRPWIRRIGRIAIVIIIVAALALPVVLLMAMPEMTAVLRIRIAKLIPPLSLPLIVVLVAEATLLMFAAIWWLWWRLPKRQVHDLDIQIHDPKARADVEDNFRKTAGQALGGAAVLIGAAVAYLQFTQQQQASHDLLISNQVSKGFEQLASYKITERLGGIYALEGVMNTSDQYHQPVLEALCAFVRSQTTGKTVGDQPAIDVQAGLTVILRRKEKREPLSVIVRGAVNLTGANIPGAHLWDEPQHWGLVAADLSYANLTGAILPTELALADLSHANLTGDDFSGVNLQYASLHGANLSGADLSRALNLTQVQLNQACGKPKALPPDLTLDKPCPPPPTPK
jgi:uncharacterized protein YjbI with pentapeptide repeats